MFSDTNAEVFNYHVCVRRRCVHVSGRVVFVSFVRCMSVGIVCTLPRRQR